jgi:hypothetical protein
MNKRQLTQVNPAAQGVGTLPAICEFFDWWTSYW